MKMQRVINFSGGKTSAYMTIMEYQPGDIVLFCDTGREHSKTHKFINDFEANENIPIIRIAHPLGFEGLLKKESFIPNQWKRKCTIELKIKTARRCSRCNKQIPEKDSPVIRCWPDEGEYGFDKTAPGGTEFRYCKPCCIEMGVVYSESFYEDCDDFDDNEFV